MTDNVNHPQHYTSGKVECIDALEAATQGLTGIQAVCTANAIKYLWRWKQKNGAEDLKKARWYLDRLIGTQEADSIASGVSVAGALLITPLMPAPKPAKTGRDLYIEYKSQCDQNSDGQPLHEWCELSDEEQSAWNAKAQP